MPTDTKHAFDPEFLYGQLIARLKHDPEAESRIIAYVRSKTGHATLPSYHNNGAKPEEKATLYRDCLKALLSHDFSALAIAPEAVTAVPVHLAPAPAGEPPASATEEKVIELPPTVVSVPSVPASPCPSNPPPQEFNTADAKITALVEALRGVLVPAAPAQAPHIDEQWLKAIVRCAVKQEMVKTKCELLDVMQKTLDEWKKKMADAIADA